jgi:GntR family transcriptional regulator, rspAB operon transcriptional repressor
LGKQLDLKQKAYKAIKDKVIKCELLPGEDISETDIAREIGISRTPVREALMRLEHEKFITIYPRKGIVVSNISIDIINDIFQIRQIVEPQILYEAAKNLPISWLKEMREKFYAAQDGEADFIVLVDLDKEFHKYIINASGNAYLQQLMENIYDQNQRIRVMSSRDKARLHISNSEHISLIDSILDKKPENAVKKLREHLDNARASALKLGR